MKEEFIYYPPTTEPLPFRVTLAGTSYCDGSYRIHRHNSNILVMEYILSGEGTIIAQNHTIHAQSGDIYLLAPGHDHEYYADPHNPWVKVWFNAHGPLISHLLSIYNPEDQVLFSQAGGLTYWEQIHCIGKDTSLSVLQKHEQASIVFHQLLQYLYGQFHLSHSTFSRESIQLKEYIDNHLTHPLTLETLSAQVHLSESQIIRIFKEDFGYTPYDYILHSRLNHAKLLLQNTRLSIKEIAYRSGYTDEHYFSYLFKQKTGQTPSSYRKQGVADFH